jgi:hypothetical protein
LTKKSTLFSRVCKASNRWGETNDCTVKAVAIAAGVTYEVAHAACALHGRDFGKGLQPYKYHKALKYLGFKVTKIVDAEREREIRALENAADRGGLYADCDTWWTRRGTKTNKCDCCEPHIKTNAYQLRRQAKENRRSLRKSGINRHALAKAKTVKAIPTHLPSRGVFLIRVSGHVLCARAGKIHDWSVDTTKRVKDIYQVERIKEVV